MLKKEALIFVLISLAVLPLASADVIFSDDFEDGNLLEWNLSSAGGANNWSVVQTDPQEGASHAQSKPQSTSTPASVMDINISTLNYEDITLRYYRKLIGLDAADTFEVEWFTGSSWIILESISSRDDGSYFFTEFNLSSTANNNSNLRIKFECTAGAVSEFCRVDNVRAVGR